MKLSKTILLSILSLLAYTGGFAQSSYSDYGYSQRDNLYYDSFNDNYHKWKVGYGSDYSASITSGYYKWAHTGSEGTTSTDKEIILDTSKDFEIEAKYKIANSSDSYLQSITWGGSDSERNYFGFTPDGQYRISNYEDGEFSAYKDFTELSSIKKYDYNKLTVRKVDSKMYFFINGILVHTMYFKRFYGNLIGLEAASATLHIDYFRVSYLTKNASSYNYVSYSDKTTVFYDSFNDNHNDWSTGSGGNTKGIVTGGYYHWQSLADKSSWTSENYIKIDEKRDFEIEAKIKYQSGRTTSGIMLSWGRSESNNNNYNMEFSGNGKYWIGKYEDGDYVAYKGWTASSIIKKYDYNKMTVRKVGAKVYFFYNEKLVHTDEFRAFFGNNVGFTTPSETTIRVDYLRISYLDKSAPTPKPEYNTPPQITITEPSGVASRGFDVVEVKSTKVAGKVFDTDGVYKVEVNGKRATVDADGNFYTYVYLADGSNSIKVSATDNKFKTTTESFKLTLKEEAIVDGGGGTGGSTSVVKQKRLALVIGNSNYTNGGTLRNPVNDARAMKASLEKLGFKVLKYENCDQATMKRAIDDFGRQLKGYDVGLFFYAGHGLQVDGRNFLVPTDAKIEHEDEVEYDCVMADRVLSKMENSEAKTNMVILDACRNNPFERSWNRSGGGKGLAFMNAPAGSLIAYATSPGNTASDGSGSNGLYTEALLSEIDKPNVKYYGDVSKGEKESDR